MVLKKHVGITQRCLQIDKRTNQQYGGKGPKKNQEYLERLLW